MILKKPYAFLIRHFKLIHLILEVLLCLIFYYTIHINSFFNAYIANGYKATSTFNLLETYTPPLFLISIIFAIVLPLILYILLEYKKKPNKVYALLMIYNVITLALYFYMYSTFDRVSNEILSSTLVRVIRDVSIIYAIPMLPFIAIILVRSVGFNLKEFSFESDFKDMGLDYKDSEEVEIGLNLDGYKVKRKIKKSFREFKYYLVENRFVVILILVIAIGTIGYTVFTTVRPSYERYYTMGRAFTYSNYEITVEDALLTRTDYKGNEIESDKEYLVLKLLVKNQLSTTSYFNINVIKLQTRSGIKSLKPSMVEYFDDFSESNSYYILAKDTSRFVAVYELDKEDIQNNYQVVISNGTAFYQGETYNKSIYIKVTPTKIDNIATYDYNLKDTINFEESFLKDNYIVIDKMKMAKSIKYNYSVCNKDDCKDYVNIVTVQARSNRQDNYLLSIAGSYGNNNESAKYNSFKKIISEFGSVEYTNEDSEKNNVSFINVTPDNYTDGVVLEVPNEVYYAKEINLIISTRYNKYSIKIK